MRVTAKRATIAAVLACLAVGLFLAYRLLVPQLPFAPPPAFSGAAQDFTVNDPRPPAPQAAFSGGAGQAVTLADFQGRVVLLNLWATWCAPCLREMPALDRLQAALGGDEFQVVALSIDRGGRDVVAPWLKSHGIAHLATYLDPKSRIIRALGARGLPTTYVIDRQGRIAGSIEGPAEWDSDAAEALVRHYLAEPG